MGLGSTPVFSAPTIYKQLCNHVKPAIRAHRLHFPKIKVDLWSKRKQFFAECKSNKLRVSCSKVEVEENISEDEACELVNGFEVSIEDNIQAYLFKAVKNNNEIGILLLSDVFGLEDSATRDFAYRVACNGYNVLVPDLFNGDPWSKERPNAKFKEWMAKYKAEDVEKTIFASAKWMKNEFAEAGISNKFGIIGFCYGGGRVIEILAQDEDAYFGSGVSFYGTRFDSSVASKIKVPLLLITGDNDGLCPITTLEDITKRNELSKMVVFQGRDHGFAHRPQNPEEDADAEEAFLIMRNWLHHGLLET